jgi:hypothetical protein
MTEKTVETKLDDFMEQYKNDRIEDQRQSKYEWHQNLMYIAWGFTIATVSLAAANISPTATVIAIIATVFFFIVGWVELFLSISARRG